MNPRQRRGALLILLAGLGAVIVFVMVTNYVSGVNSRVAPMVTTYRATTDIPAYEELTSDNVEAVDVPERYLAPHALEEEDQVEGARVSYNVGEGTVLGSDMLLPPSELSGTEREVAIEVDAVTGIAGRVASGDFVDIYAVFETAERSGTSRVLVRNVRVVSVGGAQTRSTETSQGALREQELLAVTVALQPEDALKVTYADSFAKAVRLVGLPPGIQNENRNRETDEVGANTLDLRQEQR